MRVLLIGITLSIQIFCFGADAPTQEQLELMKRYNLKTPPVIVHEDKKTSQPEQVPVSTSIDSANQATDTSGVQESSNPFEWLREYWPLWKTAMIGALIGCGLGSFYLIVSGRWYAIFPYTVKIATLIGSLLAAAALIWKFFDGTLFH